MTRHPVPSPRGADHGKPFKQVTRFRRDAAAGCYVGSIGGARAVIERDPDDPSGLRLTIEIKSAFAATHSLRKLRRGGLQREAALFDDAEADA